MVLASAEGNPESVVMKIEREDVTIELEMGLIGEPVLKGGGSMAGAAAKPMGRA